MFTLDPVQEDFFKKISAPVLEVDDDDDEQEADDDGPADDDEPENQGQEALRDLLSLNLKGGRLIVKIADLVVSFLIAIFIARSMDSESFAMSEKDKAEISELLEDVLPSKKEILPPWLLVAMAVGSGYIGPIRAAVKQRKENERAEALRQKQFENALSKLSGIADRIEQNQGAKEAAGDA